MNHLLDSHPAFHVGSDAGIDRFPGGRSLYDSFCIFSIKHRRQVSDGCQIEKLGSTNFGIAGTVNPQLAPVVCTYFIESVLNSIMHCM